MAEDIIKYLEIDDVQLRAECSLDWDVEPRPLDTGDAVAFAVHEQNISGAFLMLDADTWIGGGISKLIGMKPAAIWAEQGVRCNATSPGGVLNTLANEFVMRIGRLIPAGRLAHVDEYHGAMQFLFSDASKYLTGQNIVMDGGRSV